MIKKNRYSPRRQDRRGACLLCGKVKKRVGSHIIPQFVTRYLRNSSATGHLRTAEIPNKREQSGPWDYLHCRECETHISKWERSFAKKAFRPVLEKKKNIIQYGPWLPLFATSLVWRVLVFHRVHDIPHKFIDDWGATDDAAEIWRKCLLGELENPGPYEQHAFPFDYVVDISGPFPQNINTYLMRSSDFRILSNGVDTYVYVKLPAFLFLGLVHCSRPKDFKGTKLDFKGGVIGGKTITAPGFVSEFIMEGANTIQRSLKALSERQRGIIDDQMKRDPDRAARSSTYEADRYDAQLAGRIILGPDDIDYS